MLEMEWNLLISFELNNKSDSWTWELYSKKEFTVRCLRIVIDNKVLPDTNGPTYWNKYIPKKVNVFGWRLLRDRLSTKGHLAMGGIHSITLDCKLCKVCAGGFEDLTHLFVDCTFNRELRMLMSSWLRLDIPDGTPSYLMNWIRSPGVSSSYRKILEAIMFVWWWLL